MSIASVVNNDTCLSRACWVPDPVLSIMLDTSFSRNPWGMWCYHQLTIKEVKWSPAWVQSWSGPGLCVLVFGESTWSRARCTARSTEASASSLMLDTSRSLFLPGIPSEEEDTRGRWPLLFQNPQGPGDRLSLIRLNRAGTRKSWDAQYSSHTILPSPALACSLGPGSTSSRWGECLPFLPSLAQLLQSLLRVHVSELPAPSCEQPMRIITIS